MSILSEHRVRSTGALMILICSSSAFAQTVTSATPQSSSNSNSVGQQIVVTGLARKEILQKAPVSATVLTTAAIRDARVEDVYTLAALVPSVSISQSQGAGVNLLTIRGISQVQNGQPPAAIVVDGVQQMDSRQFVQDLYNLSQIEVLRGPQGDLWGRNAIGGAVIINTAPPTNSLHGGANVVIGNGDTYKEQAFLSGPLVKDKLLGDISFSENYFGGLLPNIYLNKEADRSNEVSGRAHVEAMLTDQLTADLRFGINELVGGANDFHYQPANYDPTKPCFLNAANPISAFPGNANLVDRSFCANNIGEETRNIKDASFRLAYDTSFATITNVAAWSGISDFLKSDQFPYTASASVDGLDGTQTQWQQQTSWEDEFRVTSPSAQRLRWMVGGYFLDVTDYISRTIGEDRDLGITKITNMPSFDNTINPTISYLGNADHNNDYAVFGHLSYDITKKFTAEFGYRYDWNVLHQYVDPASTSGIPTGCEALYSSACTRKQSFDQGQPKVTLTYSVDPDLTFFTDYGVGFRSGQFNQSGTAAVAGLPGVRDVVKAEKANTFEVGFKSEWLNHRLTVNGTFYDTRDSNPSYLLFVGSIGAQILVNIDKVDIIGGDIDVSYLILPGLSIYANGGYARTTIKQYVINSADQGNRAPLVPDFNANLGIQYRKNITRNLSGFARFSVQAIGTEYWDPDNSTARSSFNLYDMQVGVEAPTKKWSLIFFVNNLTNKAYNTNYVEGGFSIPAEPRTFGAELRTKF